MVGVIRGCSITVLVNFDYKTSWGYSITVLGSGSIKNFDYETSWGCSITILVNFNYKTSWGYSIMVLGNGWGH